MGHLLFRIILIWNYSSLQGLFEWEAKFPAWAGSVSQAEDSHCSISLRQPPELKALGICDLILHPIHVLHLSIYPLHYGVRDLLHSVITRPPSRPICLSLLCSLICPSAHSSPSIPPSINLAGRSLSCTPSLFSLSVPIHLPSICLSGLCKGQRRQRDIGWLMLLSSLAFLSLVRTHLHAEPWFFAIAWMGISIRIYNRLLREMKMSRQIAAKNMSFHNVFLENDLSRDLGQQLQTYSYERQCILYSAYFSIVKIGLWESMKCMWFIRLGNENQFLFRTNWIFKNLI